MDSGKYVHEWKELASYAIRLMPGWKLYGFDPDVVLRSDTGGMRLFHVDTMFALKRLYADLDTAYSSGYNKGYEDGRKKK